MGCLVSLPWGRLVVLFYLIFNLVSIQTFASKVDVSEETKEKVRIALTSFNAHLVFNEENSEKLVQLSRELGDYPFKEVEEALIKKLADEVEFLDIALLNSYLPFLESIANSLKKVASLETSSKIHDILDILEDKLSIAEDDTQKVSLSHLIDELRRAEISAEKRTDSISLGIFSKSEDGKGTAPDGSPLSEEEWRSNKEKRLAERRATRKAVLTQRRQDLEGYDRMGDELGRRHRKTGVQRFGTLRLIDAKKNDEEVKDEVKEKGVPTTTALVAYDRKKARSENNLLSIRLQKLKKFEPNATKAAVEDITETITEYFSDGRATVRHYDSAPEIYGRESEANKIIDILMRRKGGNPLLLGSYFSGKTAVIEKVADYIVEGHYPHEVPFKKLFDDAHIVRIDGLTFGLKNTPGNNMKNYLNSVLHLRDVHGINIITYINNVEALPKAAINEIQRALFQDNSPKIILESQANDFNMAFKDNERVKAAFEPVAIKKFSTEQMVDLLRQNWLDDIQDTYSLSFGKNIQEINATLEAIVETGQKVYRNLGPIEASLRLMQDVAIKVIREQGVATDVTDEMVYKVVQDRLGFPVNPLDGPAMEDYINGLKQKAGEQVYGQKDLIEQSVQAWSQILEDDERSIRVGVFMGGSGAGKSELSKVLGQIIFNSSERVFTIAGPEVEKAEAMWTYFGATNGYLSSDKTPGRLMEWLDDPAGGKFGGILIIDEAERADPKFWERLMEFFDKGIIVGGDGKIRYANNLLVIMTSNKGNSILVPRGIEYWADDKLKRHQESFNENQLKDIFAKTTPGTQEKPIHPAILNRIDFFALAKLIDKDLLLEIAQSKTKQWVSANLKKRKVEFVVSDELVNHLVLTQYRIQDGFRPPKRQLFKYLDKAREVASRKWKFHRGAKIHLDIEKTEDKDFRIKITMDNQPEALYVEAPKIAIDNPLENEQEMEKLSGLLEYLNSRVFGWEETNQAIYDAIFSYRTSPGEMRTRPLSIMLVGSTGTGKSELAKALAKHLFGNEQAALVQHMGTIQSKEDKNNFLGSSRGFSGSEELTELEQFIVANEKTGGVILWDEISNMGGNDPQLKESLFKLFYGMIEEGTWTPPGRDRPYDLSKFIFIFTGNDGEKLFQGLSADDMRLAVWGMNNKKERIREILREAGIPEAFLGRMADLILAKPLTTEVMKQVAMKLIAPVKEAFEKNNVEVEISKEYLDQFVMSFFSQDMGARSLRNMIDEKLMGWVGQLYMQHKSKVPKDQKLKISLKVYDNLPDKAFAEDRNFQREVKVVLEAQLNGQSLGELSRDVSNYAPRKIRMTKKAAVITAYHEAGHAAVNNPEISDQKIAFVTIKGSDGNLGYARYDSLSKDVAGDNGTKSKYLLEMARALAGQRAQQLAGFEPDAGWSGDIRKVREMAYKYFVKYGDPANSRTLSLITSDSGELVLKSEKITNDLMLKIDEMVKEADLLAVSELLKNWSVVEAVKNALLVKGELSGSEYEKVRNEALNPADEWVLGPQGNAVKKASLNTKWYEKWLNPLKKAVGYESKIAPLNVDELTEISLAEAFKSGSLKSGASVFGKTDLELESTSAKGPGRCDRTLRQTF